MTQGLPQVEGSDNDYGQLFLSPKGQAQGRPSEPFVFYGHSAPTYASLVAGVSTLSCQTINDLAALEQFLLDQPIAGLSAMSRMEHIGEAGSALALLRKHCGPLTTGIYGAWDYNTERAAKRALEYQAHGVIMPGIELNELMQYLFGLLGAVSQGMPVPDSVEEQIVLLRKWAPKSPFWENQDIVVSDYF